MGRYYNGDIEGKFWFGVQSSSDADFFGSEGFATNYLEYYFDKNHLEKIKKGIKECKKELGEYKKKLDDFFNKNNGYNEEMIEKELKISIPKIKTLLEWYARLKLGNKILECVEKTGYCEFEAEL